MLLIITLTSVVAAVALLWLGIGGRRVGSHPFCRNCGYDVSGKDRDSESCPECGYSLRHSGAVCIGQRQRRPKLIAAGVTLLVLGGGLGGGMVVGRTDLNDRKPAWLLTWEMNNRSAAGRQAAFNELFDRLILGRLSPVQHRRFAAACLDDVYDLGETWSPVWSDVIADAGLELKRDPRTSSTIEAVLLAQADEGTVWSTDLGSRVEWLREMDLVSDEQWATYLRQSVEPLFEFSVPDRIRPGSYLQISYERGEPRLGSRLADGPLRNPEGPDWSVAMHYTSPFLNGKPVFASPDGKSVVPSGLSDSRDSGSHAQPHTLAPGTHALEFPVEFVISRITRRFEESKETNGRWVIDEVTPVTSWKRTYRLPLEVVPDSVDLVELTAKPERADAIRSALSVRVLRTDEELYPGPGQAARRIESWIRNPPQDLAFEVFLRNGDREMRIGIVACKQCEKCGFVDTIDWPDAEWLQDLDRADAVFRPDIAGAERRGMRSIWGDEIVLRDVCLKRVAFRDASREEQVDRLREVVDVSRSTPIQLADGRVSCRIAMELKDPPVPLHHQVACRVGDQTIPLGEASLTLQSGAYRQGSIELDEAAEPPLTVDVILTPIQPPDATAPVDAWLEAITIPDVPARALPSPR